MSIPDELVQRARAAWRQARRKPGASWDSAMAAALAAVADDLAALGRPPVCRDGCQLHAMRSSALRAGEDSQ